MLLLVELALPNAIVPDKGDPPGVEIPAWVTHTTDHPNLHGSHALDQQAFILSVNWDAGLRYISSSSPLPACSLLEKGRVRIAAEQFIDLNHDPPPPPPNQWVSIGKAYPHMKSSEATSIIKLSPFLIARSNLNS